VASPFTRIGDQIAKRMHEGNAIVCYQKDEQSMAGFILPIAETIFDPKGPLPYTHRKFTGRQTFLQRIQSLEMFAVHGKVASLRKLYDHAVRKARTQNTTNFCRINAAARDALKAVFESYNRFMLTTSGELNYPSNCPR
jgi:hypothetical protein